MYNYIMSSINTPGSYCVEYSGHILTLTSIGDCRINSNDNNIVQQLKLVKQQKNYHKNKSSVSSRNKWKTFLSAFKALHIELHWKTPQLSLLYKGRNPHLTRDRRAIGQDRWEFQPCQLPGVIRQMCLGTLASRGCAAFIILQHRPGFHLSSEQKLRCQNAPQPESAEDVLRMHGHNHWT